LCIGKKAGKNKKIPERRHPADARDPVYGGAVNLPRRGFGTRVARDKFPAGQSRHLLSQSRMGPGLRRDDGSQAATKGKEKDMKKFLFVLFGVFVFSGAFAAGENVPTSKGYVDSKLGEKQDIIPTNDGAARVLTNTGTAGEYGTKGIYDATGEYATQTQNLVDAATMNAGVQNAIDSEFQCIEWLDPNDHTSDCLLFNIFGETGKSVLPTGFTALEYIESTGTQYIDTGITVKATTLAEFEYQFVGSAATNYVFGQIAGFGNRVMGYRKTAIWWFRRTDLNLGDNDKHKVVFDQDGKVYRDGFGTQQSQTILLFAERNDNSAINKGKVKIYNFKLKEGTTPSIIQNLIPARRNSDGVLGMYDTVSNTFFTNAGTGEFIAGPVVYLPHGE